MSKWIVDIHGELEGDYELICKAESTIPLDKIKEAREEIENLTPWDEGTVEMYEVLEILDKLIESEEDE
jgi:hypothetical protein